MHLPFDILKKEPDGSFRSLEAVTDLRSALTRNEDLLVSHPGDYVLFAQRTPDLISGDRSGSRARLDTKRE
jgi:hypothetical protein